MGVFPSIGDGSGIGPEVEGGCADMHGFGHGKVSSIIPVDERIPPLSLCPTLHQAGLGHLPSKLWAGSRYVNRQPLGIGPCDIIWLSGDLGVGAMLPCLSIYLLGVVGLSDDQGLVLDHVEGHLRRLCAGQCKGLHKPQEGHHAAISFWTMHLPQQLHGMLGIPDPMSFFLQGILVIAEDS